MRRGRIPVVFLTLCLALAAPGRADPPKAQPRIEDYATIEAYSDGVPVYAFGYSYIYGVSPDLLPGVVMQEGNTNPVTKVKPKKSWEIEFNLCGSTPDSCPRTMWNDDQPLLPIHLIDGDPETAWCSRGGPEAKRQPEWIRIDLPAEATISSIALVCSKIGPGGNFPEYVRHINPKPGKALPKELTIKLSRDAMNWETVYENNDFSGPETGPRKIDFEPRLAKQIWIIADNFPGILRIGHAFSIGEVEIYDPEGNNLALITRGSGVQVSSTNYGYGMDRFTQDMLWPVQYDLGFKWTRVGYDSGLFLWKYVEREKGKLQIDPKADAAITEAHNNGVNVILCLDKGNWLYHDPPRKVDWKKSRIYEMTQTYFDHPGWPSASDEQLQGYLHYVDYMVRHFKGRIAYYEICNEWNAPPRISATDYAKIVKAAIPVIKNVDPDAKIMLGATGGVTPEILQVLGGKSPVRVTNGRFQMADGARSIAVTKNVHEKDVEVDADAKGNAEAGIILRYQDAKNYVLAVHAEKTIYLHEVVNGNDGPPLARVPAEGFETEVHLVVRIKADKISFSVSDGKKTVSTQTAITHFNEAGKVGIYHNFTSEQSYDNVRVLNVAGKTIFEDDFDQPDGRPAKWNIIAGGWEEIEPGIAPQLDAIAFHICYGHDPGSAYSRSYHQIIEDLRAETTKLGFNGIFSANEWTYHAPYPGHAAYPWAVWCTEMGKAKYASQLMTLLCGMDVMSLWNETFQTGMLDPDVSLFRNCFSVDPISTTQPQPAYYVLRNISTVMDNFRAYDFNVEFTADKELDIYTFRKSDNEMMVAAWMPGRTKDGIVESKTDISIPNMKAKQAWVIDVFNGTEQKLNINNQTDGTVLKGMLIKDYPVFVRLIK